MNITLKIRLLVIFAVLLFWVSHWLDASIPEDGIDPPWIIVGIIIMLVKTLPLWMFAFIVRDGGIKVNQYLSFAALFYALIGFWNAFGEPILLGVMQLVTTSYLLWILTKSGQVSKKEFKEKKKQEQL